MDYDKEKIQTVVSNLLSNALKFTPSGGRVELKLGLSSENGDTGSQSRQSKGDQLILSVRDSGIGIPPEQLPRIFDRFFQIDTAPAGNVGGTGIGLAIAKELVEVMGGTIGVRSAI